MNLDERARKICREIAYKIHGEQARFEAVLAELRAVQEEVLEQNEALVSVRLADARKQGLLRAAEIVEQEETMFDVTGRRMREIAAHIRKLATEPNP